MRIALMSDIHGNSIALDAVLADIQAYGGVKRYYILGDMVAIGFDPIGVLERLTQLHDVVFIRGNTERYLLTGKFPGPTAADCEADPTLWPIRAEVAGNFAWSLGAVTAAGWREWLGQLPLEHRFTLPDNTCVLCIHASPGNDDGQGIHPGVEAAVLEQIANDAEADLVCVGHTHWAMDIMVNGTRLVNLGSVSNPFPPDLRASYVVIEADAEKYRLEHRRVDYDRAAVIAELQRQNHPGLPYIVRHLRGEVYPYWWNEVYSSAE